MFIARVNKFIYNCVTWCASVHKEQILVRNSKPDESFSVVFFVVKADNFSHIPFLKDFHVLFWHETDSATWLSLADWSHERHKLAWNNPVEVSLVDSLVLLIFLDVEVPEIIPTLLDGEL